FREMMCHVLSRTELLNEVLKKLWNGKPTIDYHQFVGATRNNMDLVRLFMHSTCKIPGKPLVLDYKMLFGELKKTQSTLSTFDIDIDWIYFIHTGSPLSQDQRAYFLSKNLDNLSENLEKLLKSRSLWISPKFFRIMKYDYVGFILEQFKEHEKQIDHTTYNTICAQVYHLRKVML